MGVKWRGIPPLNIKKTLVSKRDGRVHIHAHAHRRRHIRTESNILEMNTQARILSFHFESASLFSFAP